jgi:phosphopantothenoylcysteine synthetase/decarboxylase
MPESVSIAYLVVCAAPLAERAAVIAAALGEASHEVTVVLTPAAEDWIDRPSVEGVTGRPVWVDYRKPLEPKRAGRPDVVVCCPATFNTINKMAVGTSDTYALGVLNEALASRTPIIAVPMVSDRLWGHPAFKPHLELLAGSGVTFVDPQSGDRRARPVQSGTGADVAAAFDPGWLVAILTPDRAG